MSERRGTRGGDLAAREAPIAESPTGARPDPHGRVLGVILAGGGSTRFGSPKAAARIAGRAMAEWVLRALEPHLDEVVLVTGDPALGALLPLRSRPDALPGIGPLGGLFTALGWAREEGYGEALVVACDMPLIHAGLVVALRDAPRGPDVVALPGRRGPEPLCARWSVRALDAVERRLPGPDRSLRALIAEVEVRLLDRRTLPDHPYPLDEVLRSVNTHEDARRVEGYLGS